MWQNSKTDIGGGELGSSPKEQKQTSIEIQSCSLSPLQIRDQIQRVAEQIRTKMGGVDETQTSLSNILTAFADRIQQILMKNRGRPTSEGNQSLLRDQNAYLRGILDLLTVKNAKLVRRMAYLETQLAKYEPRPSFSSSKEIFTFKDLKLPQNAPTPKSSIFSRVPNWGEIHKQAVEQCESTMDPSKIINPLSQPLSRLTVLDSPNQSMMLSDVPHAGVLKYNSKLRELQGQIRVLKKQCAQLGENNRNANAKLHQKNAQILELLAMIEWC